MDGAEKGMWIFLLTFTVVFLFGVIQLADGYMFYGFFNIFLSLVCLIMSSAMAGILEFQ